MLSVLHLLKNDQTKSLSAGGALFFLLSDVDVITAHANYTFPLIFITKRPLLQLLLEK